MSCRFLARDLRRAFFALHEGLGTRRIDARFGRELDQRTWDF
jgi:hypothetical protein